MQAYVDHLLGLEGLSNRQKWWGGLFLILFFSSSYIWRNRGEKERGYTQHLNRISTLGRYGHLVSSQGPGFHGYCSSGVDNPEMLLISFLQGCHPSMAHWLTVCLPESLHLPRYLLSTLVWKSCPADEIFKNWDPVGLQRGHWPTENLFECRSDWIPAWQHPIEKVHP